MKVTMDTNQEDPSSTEDVAVPNADIAAPFETKEKDCSDSTINKKKKINKKAQSNADGMETKKKKKTKKGTGSNGKKKQATSRDGQSTNQQPFENNEEGTTTAVATTKKKKKKKSTSTAATGGKKKKRLTRKRATNLRLKQRNSQISRDRMNQFMARQQSLFVMGWSTNGKLCDDYDFDNYDEAYMSDEELDTTVIKNDQELQAFLEDEEESDELRATNVVASRMPNNTRQTRRKSDLLGNILGNALNRRPKRTSRDKLNDEPSPQSADSAPRSGTPSKFPLIERKKNVISLSLVSRFFSSKEKRFSGTTAVAGSDLYDIDDGNYVEDDHNDDNSTPTVSYITLDGSIVRKVIITPKVRDSNKKKRAPTTETSENRVSANNPNRWNPMTMVQPFRKK